MTEASLAARNPTLPAPLWWNGNAFRSRLLDAFSVFLPAGEQFVNQTMGDWLAAQAQSAGASMALQDEVQRLIREEASHARAHALYNTKMAQHNAAVRPLEQRMQAVIAEMHTLRGPTRMAFVAAFEQLTSLLSKEIQRQGTAWLAEGETPQRRLWLWHTQEELEHSHVAFDVLQAAGVGRGRYRVVFLAALFYLASDVVSCTVRLCWSDVRAGHVSAWRVVAQAFGFALRALPSFVRVGWGATQCLVLGRFIR